MSTAFDRPAGERARYVALARRYRPTRFDEVIGQQHVTRTLQNAIAAGRVHHAYLFTGSRGIGKTTVARILARALNHPAGPTPDPPPPQDAEGEIRNAVDVIEIDGASHTGVDDVRGLRENVRYLPAHARYKIYIIDEVHMLSTSAFNALLKTLEEPPPHVVFVFATTEPHKIPATILSRCQRFDFKRVSTPMLVTHLQHLLESEQVRVEQGGLSLIARAAEGGVRDALSLLDQLIAYAGDGAAGPIATATVAEVLGVADRRVLFALSAAILAREPARALTLIDQLFADGHDMAQFAQAFVVHLRDLVVVGTCDKPEPLVEATDSELRELREQAQQVESTLLQLIFERFVQSAEQIARSSFPRLLIEMAVIELAQMEPLLPLGDLLQRLEALERRIAKSGTEGGTAPGAECASPPTTERGPRRADAARQAESQDGVPARRQTGEVARPTSDQPASPSALGVPEDRPQPQPTEAAGTQQDTPARPVAAQATQNDATPAPGAAKVHGEATRDGGPAHTRFRALLGQLRGPWVGIYAAGRLIRWEGSKIELGFMPEAFELHSALEPGRLAAFKRACEEQLGQQLQLTIRPLNDAELRAPEIVQQSAIEAREQEKLAERARLREEALAHPITRVLIDEMGAQVKEVRTEVDGPH